MLYISQSLIILLMFSLYDPCHIRCKEAAKLSTREHVPPLETSAVALSLSPSISLITFEPRFCFQTGLTLGELFQSCLYYTSFHESRDQIVHGWPFHDGKGCLSHPKHQRNCMDKRPYKVSHCGKINTKFYILKPQS